MYFFYFDESGTPGSFTGVPSNLGDHLYVLLAVGMFARQWHYFDRDITNHKLKLIEGIAKPDGTPFEIADCEVKSNWLRVPAGREKSSPFLTSVSDEDRARLTYTYYSQIFKRKTVIIASIIDERYLEPKMTREEIHMKAYEFILERIQHYMREYRSRHQALIVMDDNSVQINRIIAMKHAQLLRSGNQNMRFKSIVEYPFFTRSELSNGVQLADLLAYNVFHAFRSENVEYHYFSDMFPCIYRRKAASSFDGIKVWPDKSPLTEVAREAWIRHLQASSHV